MSTSWFFVALLVPPLAAGLAWLLFRSRATPPELVIVLNALMPGAGLAAAGRPILEVIGGVMFAQVSLCIVGKPQDLGFFLPIMLIGGCWGWIHTPFSPFADTRSPAEARDNPPTVPAMPLTRQTPRARPLAQPADSPEDEEGAGYRVSVRCTECGADVEVSVLQHMAHCSFCGSDHLVIGHEETLYVTIPERIRTEDELRTAILDHLRYRYYLKLYQRSVSPLESAATDVSLDGTGLAVHRDMDAASVAAEEVVSRKADHYRAQLEGRLNVKVLQHFLAPYLHGMGNLYQAAFGRTKREQDKALRFAVKSIEAGVIATDAVDLPPMGKLSYLRSLLPAATVKTDVKTLPLERGERELAQAYGDLDRKTLVRDLNVIRLKSVFAQEVHAIVWRGWWTAEVEGPGIRETLLVDGAAASVVGEAPFVNPEILSELPDVARRPGTGLRFVPMECPTCGHEFPYDTDAVLHFCANCHRVFGVDQDTKREVEYLSPPELTGEGHDLVPFWAFPLRLKTPDGTLITDLELLKDGIDGVLDVVDPDSEQRRHGILVPALRFVNSRLMTEAFTRFFAHTRRHPPRVIRQRFNLTATPRPWTICLAEDEARRFVPLYLATAFDVRDLAKANVNQVNSWLFEAQLTAHGILSFVELPRAVTEVFRQYVGRLRSGALHHASLGTSPGQE